MSGNFTPREIEQIKRIARKEIAVNAFISATLNLAQERILESFGDRVSIISRRKSLRKWGRNENVGTSKSVIMTLPGSETEETLPTTNAITAVSSSSNSDTQNIILVEGIYISGSDYIFDADTSTQTLTGRTDITLNQALFRANRARLSSPAVGDIYFHEGGATTNGVPDDDTTVHMMIPAGETQTQKASTAISSNEYWIITQITASILEKTASYAQFRIEYKPFNDTSFYPLMQWIAVSSQGGARIVDLSDSTPIIIPKESDVRMVAIADGASTDCSGGISGYLATVL